jgi:hypothetical protein
MLEYDAGVAQITRFANGFDFWIAGCALAAIGFSTIGVWNMWKERHSD